ncbi:MAG: surface glycoprotein, partial [Halolamina sp.]
MTDTNKKARSLILAALMVVSVFAGTATLAAASAAQTNAEGPTQVSLNNGDFIQPGTQKAVYGFTLSDTSTGNSHVIKLNNTTVDLSDSSVSASQISSVSLYADTDGNTAWSSGEHKIAETSSPGSLTVDLNASAGGSKFYNQTEANSTQRYYVVVTLASSSYNSDNVQVAGVTTRLTSSANSEVFNDGTNVASNTNSGDSYTVDSTGGLPEFQKATHYVDNEDGAIVELAFSEDISSVSNVEVVLEDGSTVSVTSDATASNGRVILDTSGNVYSDIDYVNVTATDVDGNSIDVTEASVTFAPVTVTDEANVTDGYVGSKVAFEAESTDTAINFDGPSFSPTRGTGPGSQVFVVDTDGFDTGNYSASFGDSGSTGYLDLSQLGLSVSAGNATTEESITATVTADDINREVDVMLMNSDGDTVATKTVTVDNDGEVDVTFGNQSAGDYTVEAEDVATGVTASDSLTVSAVAQGSVSFGAQSNYEVDNGDIAEITVTFSGGADTATLVVGNQEQSGYQANITVKDDNGDGKVVVQFNTYNAGSSTSPVSPKADGDTAELRSDDTGLSGNLLETGGYDLTLLIGNNSGSEVF